MYKLATGARCGPLEKLRPPAADSFSDSMRAEAATVFSKDKGGRRYPKSRGQQAPPPRGGESWGVTDGVPSVASPRKNKKKKRGAANKGQPATTPYL